MNELINKGQKKVAQYMRGAGYRHWECEEIESGYEVTFSKVTAGITVSCVIVTFSPNWRVTKITEM